MDRRTAPRPLQSRLVSAWLPTIGLVYFTLLGPEREPVARGIHIPASAQHITVFR